MSEAGEKEEIGFRIFRDAVVFAKNRAREAVFEVADNMIDEEYMAISLMANVGIELALDAIRLASACYSDDTSARELSRIVLKHLSPNQIDGVIKEGREARDEMLDDEESSAEMQ